MSGPSSKGRGRTGSGRRCQGCGSALAADNTARLCSKCHRERSDQLRTPPAHVDDEFFDTPDFRAAFESQHIGRVFKAYRHHSRYLKLFGKALNQELLGRWLGLTQAQVSKLENGKPEQNLETLRHFARTLHLPQHLLWFDLPGQSRLRSERPAIIEISSASSSAATMLDIVSDPVDGYILSEQFSFEDRNPRSAMALAATIRDTTADLMAMDFKHGGGHTRRLLRHYFRDEVAPLLSWRYPDANLRRGIFSAAAETMQLLAWSAYDAGLHDEARRYFAQTLRLAREADDSIMEARILSNLSHQANFIGKFDEALKLARAAQAAAKGKASNTVISLLLAMEARALASLGDAHGTAQVLHRAEQLHEARRPDDDPSWIGYFNAQELSSEAAHCFRDLGQADKCRKYAELSMDPQYTPPRTLGFMRMVAASGSLAGGDADHAASLASEAIALGVSLQSTRYVKYLTDFHSALTAKDVKLGRELSETLRLHYPTLALPY